MPIVPPKSESKIGSIATEKITWFDRLIFVVTLLVAFLEVNLLDILIYWEMKLMLQGNYYDNFMIGFLLFSIVMFTVFGIFAFIHVRKKYFGMALFLTVVPIFIFFFLGKVFERFLNLESQMYMSR